MFQIEVILNILLLILVEDIVVVVEYIIKNVNMIPHYLMAVIRMELKN